MGKLVIIAIVVALIAYWIYVIADKRKIKNLGIKNSYHQEVTSNHDNMARYILRVRDNEWIALPDADRDIADDLLIEYYGKQNKKYLGA